MDGILATAKIFPRILKQENVRPRIPYLWLIDPEARTLEVFQLQGNRWNLINTLKDDDPVREPPFDAITFPLDRLWP